LAYDAQTIVRTDRIKDVYLKNQRARPSIEYCTWSRCHLIEAVWHAVEHHFCDFRVGWNRFPHSRQTNHPAPLTSLCLISKFNVTVVENSQATASVYDSGISTDLLVV
jgi:hypothetical protein